MSPLEALTALENPQKAAEMQAYHKVERRYLGVANPQIDALVKDWRSEMDVPQRIATASALWDSNIHEARIAAGKLLTQARIKTNEPQVWQEIIRWVPSFDAWAVADHAASAGSRRLVVDPARMDELESWTTSENMWARRAALIFALPHSKGRHLSDADTQHRERVLGWAATYTEDRAWFIQKAVGWWLRSLSKHDPMRVELFLSEHGDKMKAFARREASKYLS
ncbi:MAG: DNA alkylation repair protein [Pseudomonadota bacterium]